MSRSGTFFAPSMPSLIYNGTPLTVWPTDLHAAQRAIYYGDGLFESIRIINGQAPLLKWHIDRLLRGLHQIGFDVPAHWSEDFFNVEISKIAPPNARVRLTVWRSSGGFYLPQNHTPQWLITTTPLATDGWVWPDESVRIDIAEGIRLAADDFSPLKTFNAPRYVAAARQAQGRALTDLLLLNTHDRVCEGTNSNIFWFADQYWHTVPLSEGCVAGVFRHWLLDQFDYIREVPLTLKVLEQAEAIFLTNAIKGIIPVHEYKGRTYNTASTKVLFDEVTERLEV
jgi:branched-chain amino acid aminotransferase